MCTIWFFIILLGISQISNFKKEENLLPKEEYEQHYSEHSTYRFEQQAEQDCYISRIIRSNTFITIYTMITCQFFYAIFILESFKEYGQWYISDEFALTLIGTVGAFSNAFAKFSGPTLMDYMDYKTIYKYVLFFTLIQILTIRYAV